jgi:hypothetical protein
MTLIIKFNLGIKLNTEMVKILSKLALIYIKINPKERSYTIWKFIVLKDLFNLA